MKGRSKGREGGGRERKGHERRREDGWEMEQRERVRGRKVGKWTK